MKDFLIEVVKNTDGWVLVAIVFLYFLYESYKKHSSDKALDKTIEIIRDTFVKQTDRIERSIGKLADQLSSFLKSLSQ